MRVAVLVSGGVDSSVALRLLQENGYQDLTAFYLKIWLEDDLQFLGQCPWEEDLKYARQVCEEAGVPLEVLSLQTAYWDRVVAHTVAELKKGHTPSPDILCNQRVKFGAFLDLVGDSFDLVASGHYARLENRAGLSWLLKGLDPIKDQTYFLSQMSQAQLQRCLFPIGHYSKDEVRQLAAKFHLANQARKDSQGICFLGKIKYNDFVKAHLGEKPGPIVNYQTGETIGQHQGFWFHTIGQRRGLGLSGGPWYVTHKDSQQNIVYVSLSESRADDLGLSFRVHNLNWLSKAPEDGEDLSVKIRHGARTTACKIRFETEGYLHVELAMPDGGIAPGQYAVFYRQDVCLGSGVIAGPAAKS